MKTFSSLFLSLSVLLAVSCAGSGDVNPDWLRSDYIPLAIDESLRPIMEEEIHAFELRHVDATFEATACAEQEALRLLVSDSVRMAIATRRLNDRETAALKDISLRPTHAQIATDAFALIVNKENHDTLIMLDEIKDIVTGKITRWEQLSHSTQTGELLVVFDNEGSSTVRYMRDSLCVGDTLSSRLHAQGSTEAVIELVKERDDVLGVVGVDWLRARGDSLLTSYRAFRDLDINVMQVSRLDGAFADFYLPFQYDILMGNYPLVRSVYVISTDPRSQSMQKTFFHFLKGNEAQTIICNSSQMLPYRPVQIKSVSAE